jgi:hypothetical protein
MAITLLRGLVMAVTLYDERTRPIDWSSLKKEWRIPIRGKISVSLPAVTAVDKRGDLAESWRGGGVEVHHLPKPPLLADPGQGFPRTEEMVESFIYTREPLPTPDLWI